MKYFVLLLVLALALLLALRLFRRPAPTPIPEDIDSLMSEHAEDAVKRARSEFGVTLDYGPNSVKHVESILERVHTRHQQHPLDERTLGVEARLWGAYLGSVIKRLRPCIWQKDSQVAGEGALPLVFGQGNETYPCAWVYKRIKNGEEDNVATKFQVLIIDRDTPPAGSEVKPD